MWEGRTERLSCEIRKGWHQASRPLLMDFRRPSSKVALTVEVLTNRPRSEARIYTRRKVPQLTTRERNKWDEAYRRARLTETKIDRFVEKQLLSAEDAQRLKDQTEPKAETVYAGPKCDSEELLFCVLIYLWRNQLVSLDNPNDQREWVFLRRFIRVNPKQAQVERRNCIPDEGQTSDGLVRAQGDAMVWETLKRMENPYTYLERVGGVRSYVKKTKRSLLVREKSSEELLSSYDETEFENDDERLLPTRTLPVTGPYSIPNSSQKLNVHVRTLYRWVDRGYLDFVKIKGNLMLTDEGMNQAKRLRAHDEKRQTLMDMLMDRGSGLQPKNSTRLR